MMRGLVITLVALLVVLAVSVGAYNVFTNSNNKPMPLHDMLSSFSKLNISFKVSTDTIDRAIKLFTDLNDEGYKFSQEYQDKNFLEKLFEDWLHNSFIVRVTLLVWELLSIVFSVIVDFLILLYEVFNFAYQLLLGVPA